MTSYRPRPNQPRLVAVLALTGLIAACAPDVASRGNMPAAYQLTQIESGSTSKPEVAALLGSPSTTSLFDGGETWFYIGARTQQYAVNPVHEIERQVVAVTFDSSGTVAGVKTLDENDGRDVAMVERETPTAGNELGFMEQLLGNLGRFNKKGGDLGRGAIDPTSGL